jgi:protein-tyrosine phosphatase
MPVTKILMVCLGNICRSPLAEGILRSKLPEYSFLIDSAGTGDWHVGHAPDKRSIAVAKKNNIDLQHLRGRQIKVNDFQEFDHIFVMDKQNYTDVTLLAPNSEARKKVKLITEVLNNPEITHVHDPYYDDAKAFEATFELLDKCCEIIANQLTK